MGAIPLRPFRMASHAVGTVLPTGETIPIPVTTTRRLLTRSPGTQPATRGAVLNLAATVVDVVDGLLNRRDLLGVLVWNFDFELLFESHDQLDRVQRVRAQIVDERGVIRDLFSLDAQLLRDDGLYLLLNGAHYTIVLVKIVSGASRWSAARARYCRGTPPYLPARQSVREWLFLQAKRPALTTAAPEWGIRDG